MSRAGVLFDVDGTLVDSSYLHTLAWSRALEELGHRVPMARIHRAIGMGGDKLLDSLIGRHDERADEGFSRHFAGFHPELRSFDRVPDLLRSCKQRGLTVVLATSAKQQDIEALTGAIDCDDAIDDMTTSADVDASKPDPEIFATAMRKAGLDPGSTTVVGDTGWDIEAAAAIGLRTIALTSGGWSRRELNDVGAVAVYDDPADLLSDLDGALRRGGVLGDA